MPQEPIERMAALALEKGEEDAVGLDFARQLGFEKKLRRVRLDFRGDQTSDEKQHVYSLLMLEEHSGVPGGLVLLGVGGLRDVEDSWVAEMTYFVVSAGSELARAFVVRKGVRDGLSSYVPLDVHDPVVRARFEREIAFYRDEAPTLSRSLLERFWRFLTRRDVGR